MFKDRLCNVIDKFYRYSYNTCEALNMVVHESDYLDEIDSTKIATIDLSWVIPLVDGYLITDDSDHASYILTEELISIAIQDAWSENIIDDNIVEEMYEVFIDQLYRSCSNLRLDYKLSSSFNSEVFKDIVIRLHSTGQLQYILVLGWVAHKLPILAVMDI